MKTAATKSTEPAATRASHTSQPFFGNGSGGGFFAPVLQPKLTVNAPGDAFEREADATAAKVMRMPSPGGSPHARVHAPDGIQRAEKKDEEKDRTIRRMPLVSQRVQRRGDGAPAVDAATQSTLHSRLGGGAPLSSDVRGFMEPRFNADFGSVRVHADGEAASLSNRLGARAFTYGNHIFFSRGEYQPGTSEGKSLLAHELTHTIQQGHAVQRSPAISTSAATPAIQRLGIRDALDYFADKATFIPGFRLLTLVIGVNPINMRAVDRSAANLLRALIEVLPGGALITRALDAHGVISSAAEWVERKISQLGDIGSAISQGLRRFLDSLSWRDIFDLGGVWDRAKSIFTSPISRLLSFAGSIVTDLLSLVKRAILAPLARLAHGTRGYPLLTALLGQDPITGEPVPRTADTLIGGFMTLIGQQEVWENIKRGNAVARAWAWFQGALTGLLAFARSIPQRVLAVLSSLTFADVVTVAGAFGKIVGAFADIAGTFLSWALNQVISLLEILFSVVAPGVMPYLRRAQAAFASILRNPVAFIGNLVRAGRMGFQAFARNIVVHLRTALIRWLTGPLGEAGVYIPTAFTLREILKLVLSVLGLTWQNIRTKLLRIIPEPVLAGLERTAAILVTLVREGPAAAWQQIVGELTQLKDQLISQIIQLVSTQIVQAAVLRIVSMLNPVGAVIQAILAIYNTVMFFVERLRQIAAVVGSFIDSISAIAAGQVASAAQRVERTLANTLTVVISFLARFIGLGGIPGRLVGIVQRIRQPIDRALDRIVAWLGGMLSRLRGAATSAVEWWRQRKAFNTRAGHAHVLYYTGDQRNARPMVASADPKPVEAKLNDFQQAANATNASEEQRNALPRIAALRELVRSKPDDPSIVPALRALFDVFEEAGPARTTVYQPTAGTLEGDSTIVGKAMRIDWLNNAWIRSHPGSPPGSGQDALMQKLVVDPRQRSAFKYIRGHLLNENLGGRGENSNLFPITANANSQHLRSTEAELKRWVIDQKKYALYEVRVDVRRVVLSHTGSDVDKNRVDSTFRTRVVLKDRDGKEHRSFLANIDSEYTEKRTASTFDTTRR